MAADTEQLQEHLAVALECARSQAGLLKEIAATLYGMMALVQALEKKAPLSTEDSRLLAGECERHLPPELLRTLQENVETATAALQELSGQIAQSRFRGRKPD